MASRDRGHAAPLGSVHPRECCYLCGARETTQVKVIVQVTRAVGWRCEDVIACLRRKQRKDIEEQEKLFMRNPKPAA
ncbi:MAG TPA: hypothetical protein VIM33_04795 [Gaiellaceae bacterium]|jgi:alpha-D-ribose 1-methylphosphonate 5-phosphate C-P lyase